MVCREITLTIVSITRVFTSCYRRAGMEHDVLQEDPQLVNKRNSLVRTAGRRLAEANMVIFDEINNKFHITDLGRIAAKYYLKHETIEVFSKQRAELSAIVVY
jgi:replicative superfamily II helicase